MITRYRECKKCGELKNLDAFYLRPIYKGKPLTETSYKSICKSCEIKKVIKWKQENKNKVRTAGKIYRDRNKDKLNKQRRDKYFAGGRSKNERENYKSNIDNLTDVYLKALLTQNTGVSSKNIPDYIVVIKRKYLSLWRKIKFKTKTNKNGKEKSSQNYQESGKTC